MKSNISIIIKSIILTVVIIISYFSAHSNSAIFNFKNSYVSGMWCAITAVVVFDDQPANSKNLLRDRLLGTLLGAIVGGTIISLMGHHIFAICIALFIVCVVVIFFKWDGALKISCIMVLIVNFTTMNYSNTEIWISSAMRFAEGVAGGSISLLATTLINKGRTLTSSKFF
jgi:uncharacterized membrane protein YgaE (UPF0421/DUF939 family)